MQGITARDKSCAYCSFPLAALFAFEGINPSRDNSLVLRILIDHTKRITAVLEPFFVSNQGFINLLLQNYLHRLRLLPYVWHVDCHT